MGAGGQMNVVMKKDIPKRVPVSKPPFGFSDLKKAVPPHCFKRSLIRSFGSFFRDLIIIYSLYYLASSYIPLLPPTLSYVAWPLYWLAQGCVLMAFWILGHECSHHSFSEYQWVDDTVGFFIHSVCLVPYFSLKYSHRRHHAHTNNIEYDETYIPKHKSDTLYSEFLNNGPGHVFTFLIRTALALPLYMIFNLMGRDYDGFANHYLPQSGIFNDSERRMVVVSDLGVAAVLYALYQLVLTQGLKSTIFLQGLPLFSMSCFFYFVTYLNHHHPAIPHYDSTEWDWLRGSLTSIDRDFGTFINWVFHEHYNKIDL
ncbi:hypothetical protein OSB04_022300 [Centaurea solstitialis]|uniref:Fatty acid desaturase domain-containing protein n=1 Tax=Centaurea solstitialis TaxID=347529 RepID=A0AA38W5T3_9ASTR|nr:hypothetical protein OSB04_022300 [Centaurea solstitialis]